MVGGSPHEELYAKGQKVENLCVKASGVFFQVPRVKEEAEHGEEHGEIATPVLGLYLPRTHGQVREQVPFSASL